MITPVEIRERRVALGLSRKELGDLVYITEQHLGAIERGVSSKPTSLLAIEYTLNELEGKSTAMLREEGYKLAQEMFNILVENPNHPFVESTMGDILTLKGMMSMDINGAERFVHDFNEYNEIKPGTIVNLSVDGNNQKGLVTEINGSDFSVYVFDLGKTVVRKRAGLAKVQERLVFKASNE